MVATCEKYFENNKDLSIFTCGIGEVETVEELGLEASFRVEERPRQVPLRALILIY